MTYLFKFLFISMGLIVVGNVRAVEIPIQFITQSKTPVDVELRGTLPEKDLNPLHSEIGFLDFNFREFALFPNKVKWNPHWETSYQFHDAYFLGNADVFSDRIKGEDRSQTVIHFDELDEGSDQTFEFILSIPPLDVGDGQNADETVFQSIRRLSASLGNKGTTKIVCGYFKMNTLSSSHSVLKRLACFYPYDVPKSFQISPEEERDGFIVSELNMDFKNPPKRLSTRSCNRISDNRRIWGEDYACAPKTKTTKILKIRRGSLFTIEILNNGL